MKKIMLFGLSMVLMLLSCSKQKSDPVSKTQLLTSATWYHVRTTSTISGVTTESTFSSSGACAKDDPFDFKPFGKLIISQGASKCVPGSLDYRVEWDWELTENESIISLCDGICGDWQILKLTPDSLLVKIPYGSSYDTDYYAHAY